MIRTYTAEEWRKKVREENQERIGCLVVTLLVLIAAAWFALR